MQKSNNNRCVVYARYSCHNQTEQSIEGQMHDCEKYAEAHGLQIVDTYIDRALTATSDRRPQFQQMIRDSSKKLFDTILVWKLDRFARNRYDSAVYKRQLRLNGVSVISVMENITDSPEGVLMESVLEGFAEYFSKDLSQKVQRGMRETAMKHKIVGKIPFGYCKSPEGTYAPDPVTAPAVKMIFTMYVAGERKEDIADYLNNHGYKTVYGNKFTKDAITPLVQNTRYIGKYKYDDMELYDDNQRIISDELFELAQVQAGMLKNAGSMHRAKDRYLLTGKLYCGYCQSKMHGETGRSRNGKKHYYYLCTGRKKKHECDARNIQKDFLENYVMDAISRLLNDNNIISCIVDTIIERQSKSNMNVAAIAALTNQLNTTNRKINNIMSAIEEGIVTPTTKQRLQELEAVRNKLEYEIDVKKAQRCRFSKSQLMNFFKSLDLSENAPMKEKQMLIKRLIDKIYIWDDKILILYNLVNLSDLDEVDSYNKDFDEILKAVTDSGSVTAVFGSSNWARTSDPLINSQ
ncbi:MAG: recombinase family protein, partial [Candidatus Ornithomonoglobus sp.]